MSRRQEDLRMKQSMVMSRGDHHQHHHPHHRQRRGGNDIDNDIDVDMEYDYEHHPYMEHQPQPQHQPRHQHVDVDGRGEELRASRSSRRSMSPPQYAPAPPQYAVEGGGRRVVVARERRSGSLERRRESYYEQEMGQVHGGGDRRVLSRSPQMEHVPKRGYVDERVFSDGLHTVEHAPKRVHVDEMGLHREYEYPEYAGYDKVSARSKQAYGYDDPYVMAKEKDYGERRSGTAGHGSMVQKPVMVDDAMDREMVSRTSHGYPSKNGEASGNYSTADTNRYRDENIHYQNSIPHDRVPKDVYYKEGNNSAYYPRESAYLEPLPSQVKNVENRDVLKGVSSTSAALPKRGEYGKEIRGLSDVYPNGYGQVTEPPIYDDDYGQRGLSDARRGYEAGPRDPKCSSCDTHNLSRVEQKHYMYPEVGRGGDEDLNYIQGNSYEKSGYVCEEHGPRGPSRPDIVDRAMVKVPKADDSPYSRRLTKDSEHGISRREVVPDYVDTRRSSYPSNKSGDYVDQGYTHPGSTKTASSHQHIPRYDPLENHAIEDPHSGYGYERYEPTILVKTRVNRSPDFINDMELQRPSGEVQRFKAEEPFVVDRGLKRKYIMDEDIARVDSRSVIRNKWNTDTGKHEFDDDYRAEWSGRKGSGPHSKRPSGYEQQESHYYVESGEPFDKGYHQKDSTNFGWTSYHDQSENFRGHSGKPFNSNFRHFKGYTKHGFSKNYSHGNHSHQRNNHYKQQDARQRGEENHVSVSSQDANLSDGTAGQPPEAEESEEFKQNVQSAYLDFSKRIIGNPTACKLYKENGRAGTLFCIVCRRSSSKDFQDTKGLASHAFMSHKVGLRALHLGLHRAICVLMGWSSLPDPELGTWHPAPLPKTEALAKKEDLILWPPVAIVRNISLSYNDHNKWKLINIDNLGEFLRAKGFNLGKMRICLGNPGDHSVILVKFLNTFSGLQEAERLHKLFLETKHGRVDFNEAVSNNSKGGIPKQEDNEAEKKDDDLLYGYMAMAEDLERVDFDTKIKCSLKSKQEVHNLANAPVKRQSTVV